MSIDPQKINTQSFSELTFVQSSEVRPPIPRLLRRATNPNPQFSYPDFLPTSTTDSTTRWTPQRTYLNCLHRVRPFHILQPTFAQLRQPLAQHRSFSFTNVRPAPRHYRDTPHRVQQFQLLLPSACERANQDTAVADEKKGRECGAIIVEATFASRG